MTFKELAEAIARMTPEQQDQEVIFLQPWDDAMPLYVSGVEIAKEDLHFEWDGMDGGDPGDISGRKLIRRGEAFVFA
jgi:hypothetical protein